MRILCLNAWGGRLHEALVQFLASEAPDVLCLQEVVHTPQTTKPFLTYRDGDHILTQRANLFADVAEALPGYHATFCPAARGVLWDDAVQIPSDWGLATFVHPSVSVIGQAQGFVHKDFSADGYGDHPRSRSAHAVRLHDDKRKRTVAVAHMHGLRDLRGKHDTPERSAQADRFLRLAGRLDGPNDVTVLCGDFNVEPASETLKVLAAKGFAELVTAGGHAGTRTSHYAKPGRFADYMLIDRPEAVVAFEVVRTPEVSDHCPLRLTF